jgi:hypothetical protein
VTRLSAVTELNMPILDYPTWRAQQTSLAAPALAELDIMMAKGSELSHWTISAARKIADRAAEAADPVSASWLYGPCSPRACGGARPGPVAGECGGGAGRALARELRK